MLFRSPLSYIVGGWRLSGLANLRSGRPFTIKAGSNNGVIGGPRGGGLVSAFADCIKNGDLSDSTTQSIDKWFDNVPGSSYSAPTAPNPTKNNAVEARLGTCGRNTLRGPGAVNLDLGVFRRFPIRELINLEFRAEAANSTNTPHFNNPNANISASNFLVVTSALPDQRQLRLGLRLSW